MRLDKLRHNAARLSIDAILLRSWGSQSWLQAAFQAASSEY
jgi:hypothetical protein